ncbi:hypothetical protein BB561_002169 [Smittium simulii]|uniref:phosphoserine transaminase n=1 Tax=Smittium simulii TaxID=133385 RepID=A0A2T9YRG5_9FUNG|nr:hypothetical protein BB561_002169 [Smittium simulii]
MSPNQEYRAINLSAGPSAIPLEVLKTAQNEFLNYKNSGMSVIELSHRSKLFESILSNTEADLRRILDIPANYKVLFMQSGGTGEFAATHLNLMASKLVEDKQKALGTDKKAKCAYIISGVWSKKAHTECLRMGGNAHTIVDGKSHFKADGYYDLPAAAEWDIPNPEETAYVYYCDNETIGGFEMELDTVVPHIDPSIPIICDMSSNILSRKFDVSKFGVIYAGAQKNIGPSGLTIVIVREDLLIRNDSSNGLHIPSVLDYKYFADEGPMPHTPTTFSIYICHLVLQYITKNGGITTLENNRNEKAKLLYNLFDSNPEFYTNPIQNNFRSKMNVVFTLKKQGLDAELISQALENNIVEIKGHRSVGGFRASIYNAVTLDQVRFFVDFLNKFADSHI